MEKINILWFKKDLRIIDNEALYEASKKYIILPLYIIDKDLWSQESYSKRQWLFCKESLLDLNFELNKIGLKLIIKTGNVQDIFKEIHKKYIIKGIYSHQETGDFYAFNRDKKIRDWVKNNHIHWKEFLQFAVFKGLSDRNNWHKKWSLFINKKIPKVNKKQLSLEIYSEEIPEDDFFKFEEDKCIGRLKGGRGEALKRLDYFFNEKINLYSKDISSPLKSFDSCSRLSPYITWGCLSIREIFNKANSKKNKNLQMLKSRLTWHCHFIQKLESEPEIEFKEFHPYFRNIRTQNNDFLKLWSEGKTGYPFLDACMKSLNYHGWINFRMRAMLMSFASYNLWLPWQDSGKILAQKFVDYEPGIHWCQCQMQSGTTSINTNRIYNPIKQGKDHDPSGLFIKTWIPELRDVPEIFIHEPWLITDKYNYKNLFKTNYFSPIVNISETAREARKKIHIISQMEGYQTISKAIYIKHGSRKTNLKTRKIFKNLKNKKNKFEQTKLEI